MSEKRVPITRVNKFFADEDFRLQESMGMEYLHGNLNFTLVLYSVDRDKSVTDDVYGEASQEEIRFFPPVEFKALVNISGPTNDSYAGGLMRYMESGNLTISVYKKELEQLGIDIGFFKLSCNDMVTLNLLELTTDGDVGCLLKLYPQYISRIKTENETIQINTKNN